MEKLTAIDMLQPDYKSHDDTVDELLERWDAGNAIWSIEMGGLGPGYEQCIQLMAVEFARAGKTMPRTGDDEADYQAFDKICSETLKPINDKLGGVSGAQFSGAKWLAWQWCFNGGPKALIDRIPKDEPDRAIQVSKSFPHIAEAA